MPLQAPSAAEPVPQHPVFVLIHPRHPRSGQASLSVISCQKAHPYKQRLFAWSRCGVDQHVMKSVIHTPCAQCQKMNRTPTSERLVKASLLWYTSAMVYISAYINCRGELRRDMSEPQTWRELLAEI